jgi:hypothetical protein
MSKTIGDAVRRLVHDPQSAHYGIIGKVTAVNNKTCDVAPLNGDADILEVRLQAEQKKGILITPVVGSVVIVSMLSKDEGFVSMFSEVDEIELRGSAFTSVKGAELALELNKTNELLKAIKTALINWVPAPGDGGAALKALIAPIVSLLPGDFSNIQNTKVKHE